MLKNKLFVILAVLFAMTFAAAMGAEAAVIDNLKYSIENDHVVITGMTDLSLTLNIPAEIDGLPVTTIDYEAFRGKMNLVNVILPDSVTTVGGYAFYECENLKSVTAYGLETVRRFGFCSCKSLEEVNISEKLRHLEYNAFYMTKLFYEARDESPDGLFYIGNILVSAVTNDIGDTVVVRPGTTCIAGDAFNSNRVRNAVLPEGLQIINSLAFSSCSRLETVNIPDSVEIVEDEAFRGCLNLRSVYLGSNTIVADKAFLYCYDVTIHAPIGSPAHLYALEKGLPFYPLESPGITKAVAMRDGDMLSITADLYNVPSSAPTFVLGYNEDGELVHIQRLVGGKAVIPAEDIASFKTICWKSFESMAPICPSVTGGIYSQAELRNVKASQTPEPANAPDNIIDGDLNSGWACNGSGTIEASLSGMKKIRRIDLYLKKYDDNRTLPIRIDVSDNGKSYRNVFSGTITSADGYMTSVEVSGEKYQYIRVTVNGSSIGSWCSVAELQVFVEE